MDLCLYNRYKKILEKLIKNYVVTNNFLPCNLFINTILNSLETIKIQKYMVHLNIYKYIKHKKITRCQKYIFKQIM